MGIFEAKLGEIIAKIKKLIIGVNKEHNTLIIEDKSTHIHYHSELSLSPKEILNLPSDKIGDLIKQKTILSLEVASKEYPEEMQKYFSMYDTIAFATGTSSAILALQREKIYNEDDQYDIPTEKFIQQIPEAVENSIPDSIEYKGYIIRASTYRVLEPSGWSISLYIEKHSEDNIITRNFHAKNIYPTKEEAKKNCLILGKEIIDKKYNDMSLDF